MCAANNLLKIQIQDWLILVIVALRLLLFAIDAVAEAAAAAAAAAILFVCYFLNDSKWVLVAPFQILNKMINIHKITKNGIECTVCLRNSIVWRMVFIPRGNIPIAITSHQNAYENYFSYLKREKYALSFSQSFLFIEEWHFHSMLYVISASSWISPKFHTLNWKHQPFWKHYFEWASNKLVNKKKFKTPSIDCEWKQRTPILLDR